MNSGTFAPSGRALVIEKDAVLREILVQLAAEIGFEPVPVDNSDQAHAVINSGQVELIIIESSNEAEIKALSRSAPTIAISNLAARKSPDDLGVICLLPLLFDMDKLERAIRDSLRY